MKTNILKSTWIGFGKVISRTYSRLDSLSIVSRQSVLAIFVACLTVFGVGDVWGYTVTFSTGSGNPTVDDVAESYNGAGITLPAGVTPVVDGWVFVGWATASCSESTKAPVLYTAGTEGYKPGANITMYAVYRKYTTGTSSVTFDASDISNLTAHPVYSRDWVDNTAGIDLYLSAGQRYTGGTPNTWTVTKSTSPSTWNFAMITAYRKIKQIDVEISGTDYLIDDATDGVLSDNDDEENEKYAMTASSPTAVAPYTQTVTYTGDVSGDVTQVWMYATTSQQIRAKTIEVTYYNAKFCSEPCDNIVTLSAGTKTNVSSIEFSETSVATCGGESTREVTVTVTPSSGYFMKSGDRLTWSKTSGTIPADPVYVSGPTDNGNGTWSFVYRFAQNDNGVGKFAASGTTLTNYRTVCCTDPELAYATGSVSKTYGNGTFTNTLTNSNSVTVTYESSDTDVATVAADGTVTIKGAGTTTITASSADQTVSTVSYCADEASYTLTVNKADISPTLTYSPNSVAAGDNTATPTVGGNPGSGSVTYAITSASPAGCATINTSTGVVTGVEAGSVTVTATVAATDNYNGNTATATVTIVAASLFINGATVFIQAESSSAWDASACVKAWFNASGAGGAAQATYWLFNATGVDDGKKIYAAVVPADGDLNQVTLQRFASNCSDFWNDNGTLTQASSNGSNIFCSNGSGTSNVAWKATALTMSLMSSVNWNSSVATVTDQGSGVWSGTYEYTPTGTSTDYVIATNYNGNLGNTGVNPNATLSGMIVGSTYNVTATMNVISHSLSMSKTFVKGEVSFDLQGHGSSISKLTNVTNGSTISAPSEPSATGYTFGGWFTDPECTDEWNFATDEVNETMTLYAKWTANVYTITKTFSNVANAGLPASFTYTGATTTALNSTFTVDATNFFLPSSIAVTMGGTPLTAGTDYTYNNSTGAFTFSAVITGDIVITAAATAKLKSIAITTQPTTRKYFAGESFSSTGAVVTATMGDGSTKAVTASTTWTPAGALSAGSQTITASYTENGINMTATTTVDVYSVTVNKLEEDEETVISVDGVTATWTVGTKALAAGVGSTKYVFKEWQVTGASIGSTSSANTTLSNPTANVVVNAVFWKPRTVKWSVNGNDSYASSETVAYNGTISTVPSNPSGLACASTFIAWTDAAHNNGTTAKDDDSYYESKLFTDAGDFPNITAATTTFYAVFAAGGGADVNTVMWSEDWTGVTSAMKPSQYDGTGRFVYNSGTVTYTESGSNCNVKAESYAGGSSPELYIKGGEWWNIANIPTGGAATLTLTYMSNNDADVTTTTANVAVGSTSSSGNTRTRTITISGAVNNFDLKFAKSSNTRVDNVSIKVATVGLTDYVTECDANLVSVTYDANGGSTSCTNITTDKTEDFTVCSSAPTRDYYTFAGWLCSADDEVYAASATIDDAVIDADFTLTAQWTPVTYNITYIYNGGSAQVDPAPATSYTVESSDVTLQTPTYGHNRFEGWFSTYSAGVYSDQVTSIPLGSHGDITLHAKWAERHEIIFDADGTTTTIYRADDEDLSASVAGQGSVPDDPDAPSACSSKVFVGWSESEIDDETDDEPADLMKPAAGTVDADKHYYAVWAIESSETGTVTVFEDALNISGTDAVTSRAGWSSISYVAANSGDGVKLSSKSNAANMTVDLSSKSLESTLIITFQVKQYSDESGYIAFDCLDEGSTASFSPSSVSSITDATWTNKTCTVTTVNAATQHITINGQANARVYMRNFKITQTGTIYTYTAYSTSCCATKVTLSQNSPSNGTIAFGKTSVGTCGGDKDVSLTITPAAGYQLHSYEVATGSGKVSATADPAISLDNNSSAAQNITLTFAEDANGAYDVTASFSLMTVTSWTWTLNSAAIPDPLNLYVGQSARLDVAYTPAGVDASKKTYTRNKDNTYINWVGGLNANYSTISGRASTGENTTAVSFTHADGPETVVNVKVLPMPLVHFVDLVHGETFANVVATLTDNALTNDGVGQTPTHSDVSDPGASYNSCERQHLHLVGWILSTWAEANPNAGNDAIKAAGAGNYYAAGADIDLVAQDGKTYYAVWTKIE